MAVQVLRGLNIRLGYETGREYLQDKENYVKTDEQCDASQDEEGGGGGARAASFFLSLAHMHRKHSLPLRC